MIYHILNHFPDYMDDRTAIQIILSDDARYRRYEQVPSNIVSSWYDPIQDRAFTTSVFDEVPEQFKDKLVQHNTATSTASIMYPNLTATSKVASSSKQFAFPNMPTFTGEKFTVFWDVGGDYSALSVYDSSSSTSDLLHNYKEYGNHTIKFSSNVTGLKLKSEIERIKRIESRSSSFQGLSDLYYCRNLESIKLNTISCIDTVWYDCYELTSVEFQQLEEISAEYAVNCMYNLKRFHAPKLKRISKATGVFKGDVSLEEIYFPQLTAIYGGKGYTFMTNVSLTSAYLPKLETCLDSEFSYCVNLKETNFSRLKEVSKNMFCDCLCLKQIKLPKIERIKETAFYRCQNLKTIDLSNVRDVPILASTNAFDGLPEDYEILVSKSLTSAFKSAQNWNVVANHIKTI